MHTNWCVLIEISMEIGMLNFWLPLLVTAQTKENYFSRETVRRKFWTSTTISTTYSELWDYIALEFSKNFQLLRYFVIGWNSCRCSKFPLHCLSGRLLCELSILDYYDSFPDFTPSSDARWCLTDSQHWEIQVKTWVFTFERAGKFEF